MRKTVERVLLYRLGSLGDTVVALPALHLVARAFPAAQRRLLTNFPVHAKAPAAAAVLAGSGLVQSYFRYTAGTRNLFHLIRLWLQILLWRPQVVVHLGAARGLPAARRDARFFKLCGIPTQIAVPLTDAMQAHAVEPTTGALEPECDRLLRNLAPLGAIDATRRDAWNLHLTASEQAIAGQALLPAGPLPLLAVSVGTKMQSKDWGVDNWQSLLARIAKSYPGHALVLVGSREEHAASDQAAAGWSPPAAGCNQAAAAGPVLNLCGTLTPRESAAVLARARLFFGHDSGPMHLAAAVGTPCVAVFSSRNLPRVWFPYGPGHRVLYHPVNCMGCRLETCLVQRKKCILSITVDEVFEQVRAALSPTEVPSPSGTLGDEPHAS